MQKKDQELKPIPLVYVSRASKKHIQELAGRGKNAKQKRRKPYTTRLLIVILLLLVVCSIGLSHLVNSMRRDAYLSPFTTPWGVISGYTENQPPPDYNRKPQYETYNVSNHIAWVNDATNFEYLDPNQFNAFTWSACFPMSMTVILNAWGAWQPESSGPVKIIDSKNPLIIGQIIKPLAEKKLIGAGDGWENKYVSDADPYGFKAAGDTFGYKVTQHVTKKTGLYDFKNLVHTVNDLGIPVIASSEMHWYVVYHVDLKTNSMFLVDPNIHDDHTWTANRHANIMSIDFYTHSFWTGIWLVYTPKFPWTPNLNSNPLSFTPNGNGFLYGKIILNNENFSCQI